MKVKVDKFLNFLAKNLVFCRFFFPRQTTQLLMTSVFKNPAACIVIDSDLVEDGPIT